MGFELPTLPNFNVTPPPQAPSALEQYGKMLQLKSLQGEQQLQPLRMQEAQEKVQQSQIQTEQMQLEQQSQQAMMKAWSDPKFLDKFTGTDKASASGLGFDPDGLTSSLIQGGVLPKDALGMTQGMIERSQKIAETQKAVAQTGEADASQRDKGMKILADKIGGVVDAAKQDLGKGGEAFAALKQDLVKNPKAYAGVPQEDLAHLYSADLEHLPAMATLIGLDGKIADFHKSKSEATTAAQKVIPPTGGLSPEGQQHVNEEIAVNTDPRYQAGKEAVAAAEGVARANTEAAAARGSNAALAKVPKALIAPADAAATKAGEDYAQAQSVTQRLNAMMDSARKGNVVAYQVMPEEGTLQITTSQGVHRINKTEIDQYAGGGSLWQRLMGHVGKTLTGESIPKSVLDDMAEIQKIQSEGSQLKYNNSLKTINQNYGASFKPVEMDTMDTMKATGKGNDFFSKFGGKPRE